MTDTMRKTETWRLTQRSRNTRQLMPSLHSTRIRLEREWEKPGEVAWATLAIGRGGNEVEFPPADLDELIELLQDIRDDLTDMEVAGPGAIRKHNDELRRAQREAVRASREQEEEG